LPALIVKTRTTIVMKPLLTLTNVVRGLLAMSALTVLTEIPASAAPSLDVRKPPVISGVNPATGPAVVDPTAKLGQWFRPVNGGPLQVRSHEFHDNVLGQGGGAAGSRAIYGPVLAIVYVSGPGTNIIGFTVYGIVQNDTTSAAGPSQPGGNSHGEQRFATTSYTGPLYRPILVVEFALTANALFPVGPIAGTPYTLSPGPRIVAVNNDMVGWYCFNNTPVAGNFFVPGWQLPTVAVGGASVVPMQFRVIDGGLRPADPRYGVIVTSLATGGDVLSNRTTSLKISNWVDRLFADTGLPYYTFSRSSDAAVFHLVPTTL
jgi:hypothetical protein